jgi:hypothetical protein
MVKTPSNAKPGIPPQKLALMGVLGIVFVVVLVMQFGGSSDSKGAKGAGSSIKGGAASAVKPVAAPASGALQGGAPGAAAAPGPKMAAAPWPKIAVEESLRCDPFAMPKPVTDKVAGLPEVKKEEQRRRRQAAARRTGEMARSLQGVRSKGIIAVVEDGRGKSVLIGSRVVRVGDEVEGFRVEAIEPDGVRLAPSVPTANEEDRP